MREQVQRLEGEYERVLQLRRQQDESPEHLLGQELPSTAQALAHLYTRLSMLRNDLRRENAELEALVKQHTRFQDSLQRFASEQRKQSEDDRQVCFTAHTLDSILCTRHD